MSGHLYIVSGASGSGKTTLIDLAMGELTGVARAPKYSERPSRGLGDDTTHVDRIDSDSYDLTYVINDFFYGIRSSEIAKQLDEGLNVFIVLSDFRIVRRLRERFRGRASTIYVSSAVDPLALQRLMAERHATEFEPSAEQSKSLRMQFYRLECSARLDRWSGVLAGMSDLLEQWSDVVPHGESARIRAEKIRSFHLRYTDQLTLFDHVILNHTQDNPRDMLLQLVQLLEHRPDVRAKDSRPRPVIFVVAAASGAGKGLLMETTRRLIGDHRVRIIDKQALRDPKPNDRRDGMVALGQGGTFAPEFDFQWEFHKGEEGRGTTYAISTARVRQGIQDGVSQVVVSNLGVFPEFRQRFGDRVVFVYLHATRPESEIREYQFNNCETPEEAEQRIREIREVHEAYMANVWQFDHVLLNTSYKEDLFDQMLELVHYYEVPAAVGREVETLNA